MKKYATESEMEQDVMKHLIDTDDYCLVRRQFMIAGGNHRLDLMCVTNLGYHLVIYELKKGFHKDAIAQAESYNHKYKPRGSFVVYNETPTQYYLDYIAEYKGEIGICQFDGENLICIRPPIVEKSDKMIPLYLMQRLSTDYMSSRLQIEEKGNAWWNDQWDEFNKRILSESGYNTQWQRSNFWRVKPNIPPKTNIPAKKTTVPKKTAKEKKNEIIESTHKSLFNFGGKE